MRCSDPAVQGNAKRLSPERARAKETCGEEAVSESGSDSYLSQSQTTAIRITANT